MSETPEQRTQRIKETIEKTVAEVKAARPDAEFIVGKYTTEMVYYTVSVIKSEIKVEKNTISLTSKYTSDQLLKRTYLTKAEAQSAIGEVMPKAQAHFNNCLALYRKLTQEMGFYMGFNYEGDTHGIYDEYEYISFVMDGFNFQFKVRDEGIYG